MVIIVHEIDIASLGNNLVEVQRRLSYLQWSDKVQSWVGPLPKQEETVKVCCQTGCPVLVSFGLMLCQ